MVVRDKSCLVKDNAFLVFLLENTKKINNCMHHTFDTDELHYIHHIIGW